MPFFTMVGNLIIGPLKLLFEVIFSLVNRLRNPGLSIIALSLVMNFLVLPLYRRADAIQDEARETEARLAPWVKHIRRTFQGDERFMILQTFYRQNHYSPMHALRGALPLVLEIPFFIAAYQFLSGLELLHGIPFGPIRDLGAQDGLLRIGGLSVNVLPVLMTLVNLVSSSIYTRGASLKSKIQLHAMALVFLVFLYDSPAGLTMYWTLNNLFSLVKNLVTRYRPVRTVMKAVSGLCGAAVLAAAVGLAGLDPHARIAAICLALVLQLPWLLPFLSHRTRLKEPAFLSRPARPAFFFLCAALVSVLTGLLIPSSVLVASPSEFLDSSSSLHPLWYAVNAFLTASGIFVVWLGVFYLLGNGKSKKIMEAAMWVLAGCMLVNYMCFKSDLGNISSTLQYDVIPVFATGEKLANLGWLALAAAALLFLFIRLESLTRILAMVSVIAMCVMSGQNLYLAKSELDGVISRMTATESRDASIPLSTKGKNVIVFMLDRAISAYVPSIFYEKPELKASYDGFVYYPNTLSHGAFTNFGTPGLFGGYEYVPSEMNRKKDRPLADKQNEALLMLPTLFSSNDYTVTVCDPPYAGSYSMYPDLSIYDHLPRTRAYVTDGAFNAGTSSTGRVQARMRNFFCYSLCEVAPKAVYGMLYNVGLYNRADDVPSDQVIVSPSRADGTSIGFLTPYNVLLNLIPITQVRDSEPGTLLLMVNNTPHNPALLNEPEYSPSGYVDNTEYDRTHTDRFSRVDPPVIVEDVLQRSHYHVNMASFLELGKWFDFMKASGVWDNTRIILVSDHGRDLESLKGKHLPGSDDIMFYNALLMVKDFGAHGEPVTDRRFMTNADVPFLASQGMVREAVNPFTGSPLSMEPKKHPQKVIMSHEWITTHHKGNTFNPAQWYSVHDDIFDLSNWERLGIE